MQLERVQEESSISLGQNDLHLCWFRSLCSDDYSVWVGNIVIRSLLLFFWRGLGILTLVGEFRGLVKERNSRFSGRHSLGRQVVV